MSDNAVPFNFAIFDTSHKPENKEKTKGNLYKFNIEKKRFKKADFLKERVGESVFAPMFDENGINKKSYEENIEEYYRERKAAIDAELEKIFSEKKEEAERILKEAEAKSKALMQDKEKEGFEQGYNKGVEQGYKEILEKESHNFEIFKSLISAIAVKEKELMNRFEERIANIIVELTKKIIKKEVTVNSNDILINNIKDTLNKLVDKNEITIYVSPGNYEFIKNNIDKMKDIFDIENIKILKSEKISDGGVVVDSSFGSIDATMESQIEEFEQRLGLENIRR